MGRRPFEVRAALVDSVETALARRQRDCSAVESGQRRARCCSSEHNACPHCEISLPALTASLFSFNAPSGMCPDCNGLGTRLEVDPNLIDRSSRDLAAGRRLALVRQHPQEEDLACAWQHLHPGRALSGRPGSPLERPARRISATWSCSARVARRSASPSRWRLPKAPGKVRTSGWSAASVYHVNRLFRQTQSEYTRRWYISFMSQQPCPTCGGTRLCTEARYVTVGGKTFPEVLG